MRNQNIITALVAAGLTMATANLPAQDHDPAPLQPAQPGQDYKPGKEPSADPAQPIPSGHDVKNSDRVEASATPLCYRASHLIGLEVRTQTGDRLGKMQDLIVSVESEHAPFAIVRYGGTFGAGGLRIAVPLKDLKLSEDQKMLSIATTKDQFASASATPTGEWAKVANQDWASDVDRFYGQPSWMELSRLEPQNMAPGQPGHEFAHNPAETKGANGLLNQTPSADPTSEDLKAKLPDNPLTTQVTKVIKQTLGPSAEKDVRATVEKDVVTLKGKVAAAELQQKLDQQIKAIPGVDRLDDQLIIVAKTD